METAGLQSKHTDIQNEVSELAEVMLQRCLGDSQHPSWDRSSDTLLWVPFFFSICMEEFHADYCGNRTALRNSEPEEEAAQVGWM